MGLRIFWQSNAPWVGTGYGTQTKAVLPRLRALGHEVACFAFYGLAGGMLNVDGIPIYPVAIDQWGRDIVSAHCQHFRADVLISLMDVWVQAKFGLKGQEDGWAFCPWLPIDQRPVPEAVLKQLDGAHTVLPYSRFGERELNAAGVANTCYIPHGVDCNILKPMDRSAARRQFKIPEDAFVVGFVGTNKGFPARKCIAEQIVAFSMFRQRHPQALLYLHTLATTGQGGIDIAALCQNLGLQIGTDVLISPAYTYMLGWAEERLAALYSTFDILTNTSMGEGFGLTPLEAQACGMPVVLAGNSTSSELMFAGRVVRKVHPWWTPLNAWAYIPDVEGIWQAYEELYEELADPVRAAALRMQAVAGAGQYDWPRVIRVLAAVFGTVGG